MPHGFTAKQQESYPVPAFSPDLLTIAGHPMVLLAAIGLLLGLAWRWRRPERALVVVSLLGAAWPLAEHRFTWGIVAGIAAAEVAAHPQQPGHADM